MTAPPAPGSENKHHHGSSHDNNHHNASSSSAAEVEPESKPEVETAYVSSEEVSAAATAAPSDATAAAKFDYVLVGAGPATHSALQAILEAQPNARVLIVGNEDATPYSRPPLTKELWVTDSDEKVATSLEYTNWEGKPTHLMYKPDSEFTIASSAAAALAELTSGSDKPVLLKKATVSSLDVEGQSITVDGEQIQYGKLLIATGGSPKTLPIFRQLEGTIADKITTFRTVADFSKLHELAREGKHFAVIGGGFVGSELACALALHASKNSTGTQVTQVFPENGNMGLAFPRFLSQFTTATVKDLGVDVRAKTTVQSIAPSADGKRVDLTLSNGDKITVDHVIQAVGIAPNTNLASSGKLEIDPVNGGIVANAELEARRNVYVAGDVLSYYDQALGRRRVEHYDHAMSTGSLAGKNMTGASKPYTYQPVFWSDLGPKIGYEAVGVVDGSLKTTSVWAPNPKDGSAEQDGSKTQFRKGLVFYTNKENVIVGVITWNIHGKAGIARKVVASGKYTSADADELARKFKLL
ncbi:FAD/NAD(P)-binding domain-containing protein [Ramicandelaber brevisporus]|nr:FAD/NAD(P)-binding domain-containing protein [Ramicandelaber brevisporus]